MPTFRLPRHSATTVAVISFAVLVLWIAGVVPDRAASAGLDDPDHRPQPSKGYDVVNPDYRGTFGGDSKALIAIRTKTGRPIKGLFQAKRKELDCEDGSRQVLTLGAIIIHFRGGRYFDGQSYLLSRSGFESFTAVRGRISKDGRTARGKLLVIANSPYPEDDPGCNTYGWVGWHAERVGR